MSKSEIYSPSSLTDTPAFLIYTLPFFIIKNILKLSAFSVFSDFEEFFNFPLKVSLIQTVFLFQSASSHKPSASFTSKPSYSFYQKLFVILLLFLFYQKSLKKPILLDFLKLFTKPTVSVYSKHQRRHPLPVGSFLLFFIFNLAFASHFHSLFYNAPN